MNMEIKQHVPDELEILCTKLSEVLKDVPTPEERIGVLEQMIYWCQTDIAYRDSPIEDGPIFGAKFTPDWLHTPEWMALIEHTPAYAMVLKKSWWHGIRLDGKLVAVGALDPTYGQNVGWLGPSYVLPEFRGRGFQKLLITNRLWHAQELGLDCVESAADSHNTASLRNLLNAGFTVRYLKEIGEIAMTWSPKK